MEWNLLEKFGIKVDDIRDYHIIGIDPGAGDWSGAKVNLLAGVLDSGQGIADLYISNAKNSCKDSSVLHRGKEEWNIGKIAIAIAQNDYDSGAFFENFKMPPGSDYAKECYGNDFENPNYLELMKRNFQCIIDRIFEKNVNPLTDKKILLFVGRPSSDDWKQDELRYRDLLFDGLEIPGVERDRVQMAVVSEAQAALAAEVYETGLEASRCTVIVDVGSSTIDVIVARKGEIKAGEFSRQIGAGSIEENMLELALYDDCDPSNITDNMRDYFSEDSDYRNIVACRKKLRREFQTKSFVEADAFQEFKFSKIPKFYKKMYEKPAWKRFELRELKESYFGEDGVHGKRQKAFSVEFEGGKDFFGKADKEFMRKAIFDMPVFVPCTEHRSTGNAYKRSYIYRSYYDALAHFFDGVHEIFLADEKLPTQVIITGGAGIMPFVKELIHQKLGVEPSPSNHPSYTVSRGLAYIGYAEIKKSEELNAINELIDHTLKDNEWELRSDIKYSFAHWAVDKTIEELNAWGDYGSGQSVADTITKKHIYDSRDIGEMEIVEAWWEKSVKSKIVDEIRTRFTKLYKNANVQYHFSIHPQIVENAYKVGRTTNITYSIGKVFGSWTAIFLKPGKKDYEKDKRKKLAEKASERRADIEEEVRGQREVIELADKHCKDILEGFKRELRKDVKNYVEGLTPYIIRQ